MAILEASVKPWEPIIAMYVYEIGRIKADPHGAADIVPSGSTFSGAGIPPVATWKQKKEEQQENAKNSYIK
jgi:hypothetical protein